MHPSEFERYKKMKSGEKVNEDHIETKLDQSDFNRIVLDFMINGMHHPDLLHDSSFAKLLNGKTNKIDVKIMPTIYGKMVLLPSM